MLHFVLSGNEEADKIAGVLDVYLLLSFASGVRLLLFDKLSLILVPR